MTPTLKRIYSAALLFFLLGGNGALVAADCNGNSVEDATEIAAGEADDCNLNDIPDACEGPAFGFSDAVQLQFDSVTSAVVSADFDGDGLDDLAVGYFGGMAVRFTERAGEFESFVTAKIPVDTSSPIAWSGGDLDGDVDLVALETARVVVVYNQGAAYSNLGRRWTWSVGSTGSLSLSGPG